MPLRHTEKGWWWGSQGPFPTREKALQVAQAIYAAGWREKEESFADYLKRVKVHENDI